MGSLPDTMASRERSSSLDCDNLEHMKRFSPQEMEALSLSPPTADGGLLEVDFRMTVFHIGEVNTREQNAKIKIGMIFYWTDPRMAGYASPILPGTLWGPELFFGNCVGGVHCNYEQFVVSGPDEGRLKRIINYECTVQCSMDLRRFPFDWQVLCPTLVTISHWRQLNLARGGSIPHGMTYKLVPLRRKDEGVFMMLFFSGKISEWLLHSYRPKMIVAKNPAGFTITKVMLSFNIARKSEFYLAKTTAPLAVLTTAGHFVHFLPTTELADRLNGAFTMFLAAFALLYVVGDHVPRVDFLTTIDRMIFITLFLLLWLGIESAAVYYGEARYGLSLKTVRHIDTIAGLATFIGYLLLLVFIIVPARWRQTEAMRVIESEIAGSDEGALAGEVLSPVEPRRPSRKVATTKVIKVASKTDK